MPLKEGKSKKTIGSLPRRRRGVKGDVMREIKFRGKRRDNGEWVFGWLVGDETTMIILSFIAISDIHKVDPDTVGQFTGLCDKNGTEIYEGDIVRGEIEYGDDYGEPTREKESVVEVVKFEPHMWHWFGFTAGCINYGEFPIEVIGNIYENAELLKP